MVSTNYQKKRNDCLCLLLLLIIKFVRYDWSIVTAYALRWEDSIGFKDEVSVS
jgi:hypothetical protein